MRKARARMLEDLMVGRYIWARLSVRGAGPIDHEFVGVLVGREGWRDGRFDDERCNGLQSTVNN
jgi:hypothetical protein